MRPNINFQGFFNLIKANEESKDFDLYQWYCGSYGCLIGNYGIKFSILEMLGIIPLPDSESNDCDIVSNVYIRAANHLGISLNESWYLFTGQNPAHNENHTTYYYYMGGESRKRHDKEAAINRVRKFLYYHLKKREFCIDEKGITDKSRKVGDVNFNKQVRELCAV